MTPPVRSSQTKSPSEIPAAPEKPAPIYSEAIVEESFGASLSNPNRWSAVVEGGGGWRDLQNEQGNDHSGAYMRLAGGLRFRPLARHSISARLFFEYQDLKKDLGVGIKSQATAYAVGGEVDYGYAIHPKWFSAHALLGLGAAIYSSKETEFLKNALLLPFNATGARIDLGIKACTWRDAFCLNFGIGIDVGLSTKLEFVDASSSNPPLSLNSTGPKIGVSVDVIRFVENLRKRRVDESPAALYTPPTSALNKPVIKSQATTPVVKVTPKVESTPTPVKKSAGSSPHQLTGKALFDYWDFRGKDMEKEAANLAQEARIGRDQLQLEFRKSSPDLKAAKESMNKEIRIYALAIQLGTEIEKAAEKLKSSAGRVRMEFKDLQEANRILQKVRRSHGAVYRLAQLTHLNTGEAVRAYNAKASKSEQLSFPTQLPLNRPSATSTYRPQAGTAKARTAAVKPKPEVKATVEVKAKPKDAKPIEANKKAPTGNQAPTAASKEDPNKDKKKKVLDWGTKK